MDWDEMIRAHVQVPKPFDSSRWLKIFACWLVVFQFRWSRVSEELSLSSLVNLIIRYMILLQKWPTSYVHSISHLIHQQKLKRTMGFWWLSHIFPTCPGTKPTFFRQEKHLRVRQGRLHLHPSRSRRGGSRGTQGLRPSAQFGGGIQNEYWQSNCNSQWQ